MTITYQQTDTTAPSGAIQACAPNAPVATPMARVASVGGTAGTAALSATSWPALSADLPGVMFEIDPGFTAWGGGTWTINFTVRTANTSLEWDSCNICRVNSSGVNQASLSAVSNLNISCGTTGIKSTTMTTSPVTANAGDRVYIVLSFSNLSSSMSQSLGLTSNATIVAPLDSAVASGTDYPAAFTRYRRQSNGLYLRR